jgi:hypothetical protein
MTKYRVTYINIVDPELKGVEFIDLIDIAADKPEDALRKLNQNKPDYIRYTKIEKVDTK